MLPRRAPADSVPVPRRGFLHPSASARVPSERPSVDLTLERSVTDASGQTLTVRVSRRLATDAGPVDDATRAAVVAELTAELAAAVAQVAPGASAPTRADRSLPELIEAYHPRQAELLDLLRDEGELTPMEYDRLRAHLAAPAPQPAPAGVPITERPIAAAPLENDRAPIVPRPVDELLRAYQITSLKQAGAVRARRQISYEEYMALKRHFAPATPA